MQSQKTKSSTPLPYISADQNLPEANVRTFILGIILAVIMAGSNAYLVLKVGTSVSACIPAAVISMAILRFIKGSNILQNNIVQTVASAGEALAGGLAMVLPALILIGYWQSFPIVLTTALVIVGGAIGVLITVPLRRAMILESNLKFPEGVATAEVLKAGDKASSAGLFDLLMGGLVAALIKFAQTGWQFISDSINIWARSGKTVYGVGGGFSLAIVGAGYIIGFHASVAIFSGAVIAWFIGVPLYSYLLGAPEEATSAYAAAVMIWNSKIRIIGVGAMIFGSLWTLAELFPSLRDAVVSAWRAMAKVKDQDSKERLRTEKDIPIIWVAVGLAVLSVPLYILLSYVVRGSGLDIGAAGTIAVTLLILVLAYFLCFLAGAISSYMCGLMGSTNNPISGTLIMSVIILSFVLLFVFGSFIDFKAGSPEALGAAGIVILVTSLVACAASLGGDNMQDLKSGQLVGATPWKQQAMLMVGAVASALIIAPVFQLLFEAYGIGSVMPREGMDPAKALSAPKAALMAALTEAVFTHTMDWLMIGIGAVVAFFNIIIDKICAATNSKWRFPVLAIAVGIYMPLDVTVPVLFGGIVAYLAERSIAKQRGISKKALAHQEAVVHQNGTLFASGLIAGEAMVGIFMAIPFVIYQSTDVFKFVPEFMGPFRDELGLLVTIAVLYWFYKIASNVKKA